MGLFEYPLGEKGMVSEYHAWYSDTLKLICVSYSDNHAKVFGYFSLGMACIQI